MFKIIRSKETGQTAVVTGSKQNKWGFLGQLRPVARRHFRKKREFLKDKIKELAMNSKNKNIETSIEEEINLIGATNLEVSQ
jgi:hypothetical protein